MLRVKLGEGNNLMRKYVIPNIRLGATSFLLHETYVPAVRFAASLGPSSSRIVTRK